MADFEWNEAVERRVVAAAFAGVQAAAFDLANHIRQKISTPSRTVTAGTVTRGKNKGAAKQVLGPRGSNRSAPGTAPHKDFGTLRSSIATESDEADVSAIVGTALKYGRWLELGHPGGKTITPKKPGGVLSWVGGDGVRHFAKSVKQGPLAARPFIRPALAEKRPDIVRIISDAINAALPGQP